jgi:hypothetical protein
MTTRDPVLDALGVGYDPERRSQTERTSAEARSPPWSSSISAAL